MNRSAVALAVAALLAVGGTSVLPVVGASSALPADRVQADSALVVADAETGDRYLTVPVVDGTTVALEYTHSVEQTRVYEQYTVRGDRLVETRMEFESYGWGLPSGANVTEVNGTFVYDPSGSLTRLTVAPGRIAGHELHVGSERYDLVELTDGESVDLSLTGLSGRSVRTGGGSHR